MMLFSFFKHRGHRGYTENEIVVVSVSISVSSVFKILISKTGEAHDRKELFS